MKVTFYQTTINGQRPIFTIESDGEKVRVTDGDAKAARYYGVIDGPIMVELQKKLWPKNGRAYMEGMRVAFSGSYIRASKVED